ncbi:MAG TPA: hypothetical protein QKA14_02205, partial [Candidatus Megaira endosymbiont of Hartmannula sinica]|nr:hypothetical protein [Candidatus Megaera endosymbiont of Hartmannula sinica]
MNINSEIESLFRAINRTKNYLSRTPILYSETLNEIISCNLFFKAENLQKTGAFKIRGVINHLLWLKENNMMPRKVTPHYLN